MLNDSLKQYRGSFLSLYSTCVPSFFTFDDKGMDMLYREISSKFAFIHPS